MLPGSLPNLIVLLTNLDVDRAEVPFTDGGDYRSGRQARWRLEVTDPHGHVLPQRSPLDFVKGGIYQESTLRYGESWTTELNINRFVRIERGKYKLRVLYHDHVTIADCDDVAGLIVSVSLPMDLTVEPIAVEATRAELDTVRKSISELPLKGRILSFSKATTTNACTISLSPIRHRASFSRWVGKPCLP